MWTARPRARGRAIAGYTFIEIMVVLFVLSILSLLSAQSLASVGDSVDTLATYRSAQRGGERVAAEVRRLVASARKLYVRGILGNDYLSTVDFGSALPAPGSRLPLPEEYAPLGPDVEGLPQTGNVLLFAAEGLPLTCMADVATSKLLAIDAYRLYCVYPTESTRRIVVSRSESGRDLAIWGSARYPSYGQVMAITNTTQRAKVVQALYSVHRCRYLWDPDASVTTAFHRIDALGNVSGTPEADHWMPEDPAVSPGGRLIALDLQLARTDPTVAGRRALLTTETLEEWAPDGFEVKIVGALTQRKVWMHLTVEGQSTRGRDVTHETISIAHVRDL